MIRFLSAAVAMLTAFTLSLTTARAVEDTWDYSVQVSSAVQASPAKITLSWPQDTNGTPSSYTVYRKAPTDSAWGAGTTLSGSTTSYTDTNVAPGTAYEYQIVKAAGSYNGYGYIETGINVPLVDNRGKVILLVDSSFTSSLATELAQLQQDLAGDGWTVLRHDVSRTASVTSVKALIKADYAADPANVKSVFLFGHIPVPYSGQLNPDGHPDHVGAWPADVYYGDVDDDWTDNSVNYVQTLNTDATDAARMSNIPGDGKFDQTDIPSRVELQVGRVDLANMPGRTTWGGPATFASETELLRKYLGKDHAFRTRAINPPRRAILGDYFGIRGGESFAASGFRSFAPLVGPENIRNLNREFNDQKGVWIPQSAQNDNLLAYACGAGSYTSISGIGNTGLYNDGTTTEMVNNNVRGVFNLIFGSWLGDWDHEDDMLRASLATDYGLVSVWSGRPHWFIHPMGVGETIGFAAQLNQNNVDTYQTSINTAAHRIHIALMGDPTLRLHPVVPVSGLNGSATGSSVALTWGASNDSAIVGYHVYRSSGNGGYARLTSSPITATSFTDSSAPSGATYMVRAVKLESTPSGSYYNASQGAFWSATAGSSGGSTTTTPAADTTAPTVSLTAPASGATVSGSSVSVTANATDDVGVAGVQFKLDGSNLGSEVSGGGAFGTTLNTTTLTNGSHTLGAVARDAAGNIASASSVTINVSNPVASSGGTSSGGSTTPTTSTSTPSTPTSTTSSGSASSGSTTTNTDSTVTANGGSTAGTSVWVDDSLPAGASGYGSNGDGWNWVSSNPAPFSGSLAHQSNLASGVHEHAFNWATTGMTVGTGELLSTYVYLDPANPPAEIMLSWSKGIGDWSHRAYWGANNIPYGTDGTASQYRVGDLPAAGGWVRLQVPASAVGLEGATINGMSFTLYDGRATFDAAGKMLATAPTMSALPTVAVTAPDAYANIQNPSDTAQVVFTRTGDTSTNLVVNYTLGGTAAKWDDYYRTPQGDMPTSVTIPAGSTSVTMTIQGRANTTGANPETASFTLASDPAYAVAAQSTVTLSFGTTSMPTSTPSAGSADGSATTQSTSTSGGSDTVWFDDSLPKGASGYGTNGDGWKWIGSSPAPYSGNKAHQTNLASGAHEHAFNWAKTTLSVGTGGVLYTYVYLDPANPPSEIMLSWSKGTTDWNHRAYWGANNLPYGVNNTASQYYVGALPAAGGWARLEVPASAVGLEGTTVAGMAFTLYDGRATFDKAGTSATSSTSTSGGTTSGGTTSGTTSTTTTSTSSGGTTTTSGGTTSGGTTTTSGGTTSGGTTSGTTTTTTPSTTTSGGTTSGGTTSGTTTTTTSVVDNTWVEDDLPGGANGYTNGGDVWNWVTSSPAPYAGSKAHQSALVSGIHEHAFGWASSPLTIAAGDKLYTYVYLDPANPPQEIMLSWAAGTWEHRAYWGANNIPYGTNGTANQYYVGPLPATGQWVRLEVPASAVALEGTSVTGMSYMLYDGRATFDHSGVAHTTTTTTTTSGGSSGGTSTTGATVSVSSSDPYAIVGSLTDMASVTFTRTGSTAAALTVNYNLTGTAGKWDDYRRPVEGDMPISVTIPAGAASTTMTIWAVANTTNANPETAIFTLTNTSDSSVTVGTSNSTTLMFLPSGSTIPSTPPPTTTTTSGGTTSGTTSTSGGTTSGTTTSGSSSTTLSTLPGTNLTVLGENAVTRSPQVGDYGFRIVAPTIVELDRVTTKTSGAQPADWNFVDSSGNFSAPATSKFAVTVDGQSVNVTSVGFRRRVGFAQLRTYDLRLDNAIYLTLATPISEGQSVEVKNPDASLWPSSMQFAAKADALRFSPAIHVNEEGYVPSFPKKAMVGYLLGNLGELNVDASAGFKLVNASTGATVFTGTLTSRADQGWTYSATPYQKVLQADFTSFTTPGQYQLVVPGLGASLPFVIDDGIAMNFTRTYELGLYHQRCGGSNALPFTRFTHDACHTAPAEVPTSDPAYDFTWGCIASKSGGNSTQTAPQLTNPASQLYPFINQGKVDVTGGHHDAGDYSKYTIDVALLAHQLMFTADSVKGADKLDNLGIPESGDGISDIMQEAKWEADYLAKLQDADGGFYFIVYPKNREYEWDVTPDHGDQQVVWPKNTSATAASVAALAQCASSPLFKKAYPDVAATYLAKAKLGWQFLMNAQAKYGKVGAYQKVTFYGDEFNDNDELAWAACELFLATGDNQYQQKLLEWFPDPSDTNTMRWTWVRLYQSYGCAIRSYAFAARSGRLAASQLNPTYLAACENQIKLAGQDALTWSNQSAYGTAFPENSKHVMSAAWYFSLDQASDMAVAYQIDPKPEYIDALVGNMNYEAGSNPINQVYIAGLGMKREQNMVSQYGYNDRRLLPPIGEPSSNLQSSFSWNELYGADLTNLSFPSENGTSNVYPFYDRFTDTWNVTTEFVTLNQARALTSVATLAAQTASAATPWKPVATATINVPASATVGQAVTVSLGAGVDLTNARVTWEARDQQPDYGSTYAITPKNSGAQWVEVEIAYPDGRRIFGTATFNAQ
jgi:hypothetical protein